MKIGTLVKLGLLGGGIYYVKKQGGLKATWDKLQSQFSTVKEKVKSEVADVTSSSPTRSMYDSDSGFSGSSLNNEASGSIGGSNDKTRY